MSLPTTEWGNFGRGKPVATPNGADVYTVVPGPSATTPGSNNGPSLGNYCRLGDGTEVQFLQALGAVPLNAAIMISNYLTFIVAPTSGLNKICIGANDRGLTVLAAGNCTWFTRKGIAYPLVAAAVAANAAVAASAVAGTLYAATAGTDLQGNMVNNTLVGGSAAASPVLID